MLDFGIFICYSQISVLSVNLGMFVRTNCRPCPSACQIIGMGSASTYHPSQCHRNLILCCLNEIKIKCSLIFCMNVGRDPRTACPENSQKFWTWSVRKNSLFGLGHMCQQGVAETLCASLKKLTIIITVTKTTRGQRCASLWNFCPAVHFNIFAIFVQVTSSFLINLFWGFKFSQFSKIHLSTVCRLQDARSRMVRSEHS